MGRGAFQVYDQQMNIEVQAQRALEKDLRHAVQNDEFEIAYQPQFNMQTGEVVGIEALLRSAETQETIAAVGDEGCARSVRALTLRVCSELQGGDAVSNTMAQRQLATALLRWTILRSPKNDV